MLLASLKKLRGARLIAILIIITALVSALYFVNKYGNEFTINFFSNGLATLLGVAFGIPIALILSSEQEKETEKEKKEKILKFLKEELYTNQVELEEWWKINDKQEIAGTLSAVLRDDMWRAFSDGGELAWIKDTELLGNIAEAYSSVEIMRRLSETYHELLYFRRAGTKAINTVRNWEHITVEYEYAISSIKEARKAIETTN